MTTFFWEEMLAETIKEVAASGEVADYCTEYESNYVKEGFVPHELGHEIDAEVVPVNLCLFLRGGVNLHYVS